MDLSAFVTVFPARREAHQRSRSKVCAVMKGTVKTSYTPEAFIRPELKEMDPYTPIVPYEVLAERLGRDPADIVKLDANENPYGPSPTVVKALASAPYLHIYPDPESGFLRDALSDYTGLSKEYLLCGAGADELIDLLFRLMITPGAGETVVNFPPTFGMYKFDADVNGSTVINFKRDASDFSLPIDKVEQFFDDCAPGNYPRMLFLASPNNPDGSVLSDEHLKRLLALPTLVVLDEAYFEFADNDRISWVEKYNNLVVLRTFSKWAGLAGLRIGYGAFPLGIIKHLWKIKQPYNVSVAAQIAAVASIKDKQDLLVKVSKLVGARDRFFNEIAKFPWLAPFPSQSNFVLCRVSRGRSAEIIKRELAKRGVLIRYYTSPGLSDCIRVSMGTDEQMDRLYSALEQL